MSYLISLALGLLTALPLAIDWLFPLPWIALPAWLVLILKCRHPYRHGLVWSIGYYFIVFSWLIELYPMDFAGFSNGMSVLIIFLGITVLTLSQSVLAAFLPFIYNKAYSFLPAPLSAALAGALWCVIEWVQTLPWFMVPWGKLALTQTFFLPAIQSASLLGSYFVAFIMMCWAGLAAASFEKAAGAGKPLRIDLKKVKPVYAIAACVLFLANTAFGVTKILLPEKSEETITVAAIQGNISSTDKWADNSVSYSLGVYTELTLRAAEDGAELVVWPESVITASVNESPHLAAKLSALAQTAGCDIAVGAFYTEENGETDTDYNAVYLFRADGTICDSVYFKRHLVPFGEYVPMRDLIMKIFPFLGDINMFSGEIGRGTSTALFDDSRGTSGSLVCFDSIYPELARSSVAEGAEILLLSTNDSWYKDSTAVYQHNRHAVLRAVETGRYVIRAANTGVSSVIGPAGEIKESLGPLQTGYITSEAVYLSGRTLYTVAGDVLLWLSLGYATVVILIAIIKYARGRKGKQK